MKKQRKTYSQFNQFEDPKKQQKNSKVAECSISVTKQEKTHMKLNLQNASLDHQEKDMTYHNKGLPSPPKKITAEILANTCIVLMSSVLKTIVLISLICNVSSAHNCRCPEEWFTYSNSCYYIGKETKTWEESMMACVSMNSSLLYIDDEEEMKFLASLVPESWIGVFRNNSDHPWVSKNGSMFKLKITEYFAQYNCVKIHLHKLEGDKCEASQAYSCKHKFQNSSPECGVSQ
ncbi:NKG2-C type II integral membrane protein-like, partial [Carlito syrichta]|uniref:NKG2-C type II integral membrane protein-like n=1 Tax=Carlito syrichta TaxID=1868482 RepID=A0A3Q0DSZ1_CARSF